MATDVQIRAQLDTMRSLPPHLDALSRSLGTVNWPGQPQRLNFPSGMALTEEERTDIQARRQQLIDATTGANLTPDQCSKARLSLLTKLLLGSATAATSEDAAAAKLEMYEIAMDGVAPWVIDAARKRWAQGKVPPTVRNPNFSFAPSPADLRAICEDELRPYAEQIIVLTRLLSAVSIERAMDPAPLPPPELKSIGANVLQLKIQRM
jgi:hypothetical protein